jgi:Terpene cyclase DEP1
MLKSIDPSTTKSVNSIKYIYLLLAIVGTIAPWYWLIQDPAALLSPMLFFGQAFANNIAITEATDLLISAAAFFCFASIVLQTRYANELKRLGSSQWWLLVYIGLTFGIGLCCALPFCLYRREQILDRQTLSC